jgi:sRNA-binding protein
MSDILKLLNTKKGTQALKNKILSLPIKQQETQDIKKIMRSIYRAERSFLEIENRGDKFLKRIKIINDLERIYPNTFNFNKPKPLKKKILQDIIDHGEYTVLTAKLQKAIKYYKTRETYQESIIHNPYTIDLNGEAYEEITLERKNKAKKCIYEIIGRLAANIKFNSITSLDEKRAPIADLGAIKLYYKENVTAELNIIATELYGLNSHPKFSYKVKGKTYIANCQITQSHIEGTGEGETKAETQQAACLNMLLLLQEKTLAYPFQLISKEELIEIKKEEHLEKASEMNIEIKEHTNNSKLEPLNNLEHISKNTKKIEEGNLTNNLKIKPIRKVTNIKLIRKKTMKKEEQKNEPVHLSPEAFIDPSNAQELLHNLLIKNNINPPSYSIVKLNDEPPFEFEATCKVSQLDLDITIAEGSPRKAKEEAAERIMWEINALNILKE